MSLNISQRPAKLAHVNARTELHGEDKVTAFDLKLSDIPIDSGELGAILGEPEAQKRLYVQRDSRQVPAFPHLKALKIDGKIKGAVVLLRIGLGPTPLRFEACNLTKLSVELKQGGSSLLTLTVQTTPVIDKALLPLFDGLGNDCDVEVYVSQQELFADADDADDEPNDDADDAEGGEETLLDLGKRESENDGARH